MPDNIPTTEAPDSTRDALFKALRLKAEAPATQTNNAPIPDSGNGIEVPTSGINRSSLSELVTELNANPPTAPVVSPVVETPAVAAVVVPTATVTAPVVPPAATPTVDEDLKKALREKLEMPKVPTASVVTAPTEPTPVGLDLTGLDPDEVDTVQLAHFAELQNPTRYAGHARRTLDHIKQVRAYRNQKQIEDPSIEFNDDNEEYQSLLRRQPGYERGDRERMERKRFAEEVRRDTLKEVSAQNQRLEQELRAVKAAPIVDKTVQKFNDLLEAELPVKSEDKLESETAENIRGLASGAAREFMLLSTSLKSYDAKDETHSWLAKFIQEQGEILQKSDSPVKTRGDKSFIPRAVYYSMPEVQRSKHFTFSDQEVLELIAINAKLATEQIVKTERSRLEKYGYTPSKATTPTVTPPPVTAPAPSTPPNGGNFEPSARGGIAPSASGVTPVANNAPTDPFLRQLMSKATR
jgi:hypothetical protein